MITSIDLKRYRLLVDLKTDLVVWMSADMTRDVPQISYDLLNIIATTDDSNWSQSFYTYRLYFNNNNGGFYVKEPNEGIIQNFKHYQLLRAKLNVILLAMQQADYQYLKNDNIQRKFFKSMNVNSSACVEFIKKEYNLSYVDAVNFLKFKKQEYADLEFETETHLHSFINTVRDAESVEAVLDAYKLRMANHWDAFKFEVWDIVGTFTL